MFKSKPRPNGRGERTKLVVQESRGEHIAGSPSPQSSVTWRGDDEKDESDSDDVDDDDMNYDVEEDSSTLLPVMSLSDLPSKQLPVMNYSITSEQGKHDQYTNGGNGEVQVVAAIKKDVSKLVDAEEDEASSTQVNANGDCKHQEKVTSEGKDIEEEEYGSEQAVDAESYDAHQERGSSEKDIEQDEVEVGSQKNGQLSSPMADNGPREEKSAAEKDEGKMKMSSTKKSKKGINDFASDSMLQITMPKKIECWVDVPEGKRKRDDSESTDETLSSKATRLGKRVPLAEKSSNTAVSSSSSPPAKTQAKRPAKKPAKKTTKKTAKKSVKQEKKASLAKFGRRSSRQTEQKAVRKLTSRQSDVVENKSRAKVPQIKLLLPNKFELDCRRVFQDCVDDEEKHKAADNIFLVLDLFQYYSDPTFSDEPKAKRLTKMSRILKHEVNDAKAMQTSLTYLQQRIMLYLASEEITSKSSGLSKRQAEKALELVVDYVGEHAPKNRWEELSELRNFDVETIAKLRAKFKTLIKSLTEALQDGDLEP